MINLFRRKPKIRPYPAVYSEWSAEFRRVSDTRRYMTDADSAMLVSGTLQDSRYTQDSFVQALSSFLEGQVGVFFEAYRRSIDLCMQEGDPHYLVLTLNRYTRLYQNLFFFQKLNFLRKEDIERLTHDLQSKLNIFHQDLLVYIQKMSNYTTLMTPVITHIRRLI